MPFSEQATQAAWRRREPATLPDGHKTDKPQEWIMSENKPVSARGEPNSEPRAEAHPDDKQSDTHEPHIHASHPAIAKRLRRAGGHLSHVVAMIESQQPCLDIAQQLHAVEKAIANAKRALVQDHIDHCLEASLGPILGSSLDAAEDDRVRILAEFKEIAKYL
jgi:uncharacterized protein